MSPETRLAVVEEALSWLNTPYHSHGRVRGAGVDCVMLPAEVYERTGLIPHIEPDHYSVQMGLHSSQEVLEEIVLRHATQTETWEPGDLVLFRFGRSYSHAGIMVTEMRFVHASGPAGMVCLTDLTDAEVADRERRFYTIGSAQP